MGLLARALDLKSANTVWERWIEMMDTGAKSKAGPPITVNSAFCQSAALACVREISQSCAQVPFKLMQDYEEGGLARKRVAKEHPVYQLMASKPNGWQTAFEFMETLGMHAALGNAYAFKSFYRGQVAELIILQPNLVRVVQEEDWRLRYFIRGRSAGEVEVKPEQIWHVRGPSWSGYMGMDILALARDALGLSMALEESASSLHANSIRPTGVYSVEEKLSPEQHEKLTAWIKKNAGANNAGAPLVLDRAAKWMSTAFTSVDAQHKEMRDQQVEEICRFFGVLPTIIGYTGDKANTYASAEVMENAHKVRTLGRWYKRIQDSANINLLTEADRASGHYFKFVSNALMASSAKDRGDYYAKALGSGGSPAFMTQDEVRMLDDLDPMGGEAAKLAPRTPNGSGQANPTPETP